MFFAGVGLALVIALVLTLILGKGIRKYEFAELLGFFFIVFLATWAGGLWIEPIGPARWGVSLLVFTVVGTVIALIVAASLPTPRHRTEHPPPTGGAIDRIHQESFLNVFLVITILTLIGAILFRLMQTVR